ncbi:MAG: RNA methyltransferase [Planctomycetota bacterium]
MATWIPISDPDDPRLEPYRDLKQKSREIQANYFIAEGEKLVRRLFVSRFPVESLVVSDRFAEGEKLDFVGLDGTNVYVVEHSRIEALIGFRFHRGVLACGRRLPGIGLEELVRPDDPTQLFVVCPVIHDPENLGTILRTSAAFGVDGILVGNACPDLFSRRILRVSMGSVLEQKIHRSDDLGRDVQILRDRWGFEIAATVLERTAEPLSKARRSGRLALLFGTEGDGLSQEWLELADRRLTIPMEPGTDSLNVAVAAGIVLHHFLRGSDLGP